MWLRRALFHWLLPAALVLPLWLVVGWAVSGAGGWVFLWVLFIAVPSVLVGQLVTTMLVRARGTVRHTRTLSWWDVLVFGVWHVLVIAVGLYPAGAFWPLLIAATAAFLALFWVSLWQLFREARPVALFTAPMDAAFLRGTTMPRREPDAAENVYVVEEAPRRDA
ncbi:MAG: MFS transporter permease [Microbacterium arborescens]